MFASLIDYVQFLSEQIISLPKGRPHASIDTSMAQSTIQRLFSWVYIIFISEQANKSPKMPVYIMGEI